MHAIVFTSPGSLELQQVPDPQCRSDEVVVQVACAGICGTDLHIFRGEYQSVFPLIPGHEFAGTVVEVGAGVTDLRHGDRVAVDPNLYCNRCAFCRRQHNNHCLNWQGVGITRPGAFAEYVAVPAAACYRLPHSLDFQQAAMIEPISCVVHALSRLPVAPADEVVVFGAGPMGLLLTRALRHYGASNLVVVEKRPERLALAAHFGASLSLEADGALSHRLRELAPHGFDIVVDATGVPGVIEQALQHLRPRGRFLQFGVAPVNATIAFSPYRLFRHDWTLIGSFALCYSFERAIAWLKSGLFDLHPLITHTVPLSGFDAAFQRFAQGHAMKVHVTPHPG